MENNDVSFLCDESFSTQDKAVLKNLSEMGEKLKELQVKMLEAEELAKQAKKDYEHYANVVLPNEMYSVGVDSIGLSSGGMLKIKRNFYCQPNKNAEDRKVIAEWLIKNGGEHVIKHSATVSADDIDKLKENNLPFVENLDMNTNSLKAFIKDKLGVSTGIQQISVDDIPKCIHFQEVISVMLEV